MLINLIQLLLCISLSIPLNAMFPNEKAKIVQSMLENNNEKLILWEKNNSSHNFSCPIQPIIQPFNRSQIITNHIESLLDNKPLQKNFSHYFITDVMSNKKDSSSFLANIASSPYYHTLKNQLKRDSLKDNDQLIPDRNCILAELYYHHGAFFNHEKDYKRAHELYKKNDVSYLITKKANVNALTSYLMTSPHLEKQDIPYIANLSHVYSDLLLFTNINPTLSYKIGCFTENLLNNDSTIDISTKESIILNALEHLTYSTERGIWNTQDIDNIHYLCAKLHSELSALYQTQKNPDESVNQMEHACKYIDELSKLSAKSLWLKAHIYAVLQKPLLQTELESVLKLFINNKKPSMQQQETIMILLLSSTDFFIQTKNYQLAFKIINKFTEIQSLASSAIILLAYGLSLHLNDTNDPYAPQWQKELNTTQFYKKINAPSHYNAETNAKIGYLFYQKEKHNYATMMPYFIAAIDSNELSESICTEMKKSCAVYYRNWAIQKHHDHQASLDLFDKAIQYDNSGQACYRKAMFILENSNDQLLIQHAVELLEDNIEQDKPTKKASQTYLAQIYLHHSNNPQLISILKQCVPLNIDKALTYLGVTNYKAFLTVLCTILTGTSRYIDADKAKKYINFENALGIINRSIELYGKSVGYIIQRISIYEELNKSQELLADINYLLEDTSNTPISTKKELCLRKIELLLTGTPDDNAYYQALECLKLLQSFQENSCINFKVIPILQEQTRYFVENNIMKDYAVKWCYSAALSEMGRYASTASSDHTLIHTTMNEQKDLVHYLLSAAHMGNVQAQLIVLPYFKVVNGINNVSPLSYHACDYAYTALCNPDHSAFPIATTLLLNDLVTAAKNGVALAYYILCDYYKNDREALENVMTLFSKAKTQYHYSDNIIENTVYKIRESCKDTLLEYAENSIKRQKKESLIDALATSTLGAMFEYSDDLTELTTATICLKSAQDSLCDRFKLLHYKNPTEKLIGSTYYKQAILPPTKTINTDDINWLRKSIQIGYLPAVHKMAELYLQQHTKGEKSLLIVSDDFLSFLEKDVLNGSSYKEKSIELLEKCMKIQEKINKEQNSKSSEVSRNKQKPGDLINVVQTLEAKGISTNQAMQYILQMKPEKSNTKKIIRQKKAQRKPKK